MSSVPRILAIGSCRVFRPLRHLHDDGKILLANYLENHWFTHTAEAGRQYVDVMLGRITIPLELRKAALETVLEFPDDMAAGLPTVDGIVVEVSSLKQHRVGDYVLNAHRVYGIAAESGHPLQPIINGHTEALSDDHVLKTLEVDHASRAGLTNDLLAIRDELHAPMLLVDHLYSLRPDGTPPPERAKITEELRIVSREQDMAFYSTKDLILEHGIEAALLDQNHYRPDFEPVVGERLYPKLLTMVGRTPSE